MRALPRLGSRRPYEYIRGMSTRPSISTSTPRRDSLTCTDHAQLTVQLPSLAHSSAQTITDSTLVQPIAASNVAIADAAVFTPGFSNSVNANVKPGEFLPPIVFRRSVCHLGKGSSQLPCDVPPQRDSKNKLRSVCHVASTSRLSDFSCGPADIGRASPH